MRLPILQEEELLDALSVKVHEGNAPGRVRVHARERVPKQAALALQEGPEVLGHLARRLRGDLEGQRVTVEGFAPRVARLACLAPVGCAFVGCCVAALDYVQADEVHFDF